MANANLKPWACMVQGNRIDINPIKGVGTGIRSLIGLLLKCRILKSQLGVPLVGTATIGEGVEVPPQEVVTPRLSKGSKKK